MQKSCFTSQLRVVCLRSIHEVDEAHWDSINSEKDLFHTHRFIRTVEDAKVENSSFWYLLFYCKDKIISTAVLSCFTVSLELFVGGALKKLVSKVRMWFPQFLKLEILFCGLPVSLGQNNLVVNQPSQSRGILALLTQEMLNISSSNKIRFICVKEFLEGETGLMDNLLEFGFFRANSIPYASMAIRWPNFESYLANLRHHYRRAVRLALRKLALPTPKVDPYIGDRYLSDKPKLVVGNPKVCSPEQFFELYTQVMERVDVKLETLNKSFFEHLYANMHNDLEILAMIKGQEILGAAILTNYECTLTFLLVGLNYSKRDKYDVYFNLVYGIVSLAIERGCKQLNLGQTSYRLKQRIGGVCIPEYFYLKAANRIIHFCLKTLRPLLFPKTTLRNLRVFRKDISAQKARDLNKN